MKSIHALTIAQVLDIVKKKTIWILFQTVFFIFNAILLVFSRF